MAVAEMQEGFSGVQREPLREMPEAWSGAAGNKGTAAGSSSQDSAERAECEESEHRAGMGEPGAVVQTVP